MNKIKIKKIVIEIVTKILKTKKIKNNTKSKNVMEWDSLAYLSIISDIEKKFKIRIDIKNIENFNSINNITSEISKWKKKV
jgi:acyl carrier protein